MKFTTKAARLNGPYDIELIERELVCGEDDVIVKNHLIGICGTDKSFYRGKLPPSTSEAGQEMKFPIFLGHESGGAGADVVVEAAGSAESFNAASEMIKHNGKFVFYSWVTTPVTLNISRWHDDGIEFVNTCLVHHTWQQRFVWTPEVLRPVAQGTVRIRPLITNEFPLSEIREGFALADKDDTAIKIVFRP